jgi:ribonucleotide reductase beta subunit family protein with ferritin-like domain
MGGQRVDHAFVQGAVEGLTARDVKEYIRYMADQRLNADWPEPA